MSMHRIRLPHVALLSAALVAVCAGPALGASACQGLEQAVCEGTAGCAWAKGYTRKDGKAIAAHCKASPKRGGAAAGNATAAPAGKVKAPATPATPATPASPGTPDTAKPAK